MDDAKQLIPPWTADDFLTKKPYEWLYGMQKQDEFLFVRLMKKTGEMAVEKGITISEFKSLWKAYISTVESRQTLLGKNTTRFSGQENLLSENVKWLQCGDYRCDDDGISYIGRQSETIRVISHPLMPIKRILNIDSGEEKIQLAFTRGVNSQWKTLITGKDTVASAQRIIALSKNGIAINSENAKEVVRYLSEIESLNYDMLPVQNSTGHLGWLPDGQFAPYAEEIEYDGESPEYTRIYNSFRPTGNYEKWLDVAMEARSGESVPARIALAGAFAAPLVNPLNALPFIIHFYGTTGKGKSVALMMSASVWAEPTVGGAYIKTFGGTKNSQELTASFLANVPMYLDELQIISDRKSFDDIIYMLCEGASKGRGAKEGGLQLQRRWNNCILTTGEMPIVQNNSGGGAAVRTIEVECENESVFKDNRTVANTLKENYGFAGKIFVEELRKPKTLEKVKEWQKEYYKELSGNIHGKQVLSASILLAADRLADDVIFHDGKALTTEDIKPYLVTNEEADSSAKCYVWLNGYIAQNRARFETEDNKGEIWGVIDKNVVYFIKSAFDSALKANGFLSSTNFLKWARAHGKILCENYGTGNKNNRLTYRKTINGNSVSCVALIPDYVEQNVVAEMQKTASKGYIVVDDEPLPFMD